MRRRQGRPEILQLLNDVEDRLAVTARLHVLEVDDTFCLRTEVEDAQGSRPLAGPASLTGTYTESPAF